MRTIATKTCTTQFGTKTCNLNITVHLNEEGFDARTVLMVTDAALISRHTVLLGMLI